MKNAILITSTICTIAMIVFINMGTKRINKAQEDSMGEVNEWMNEYNEKLENQIAMDEPSKEAVQGTFSERMRYLSRKQESINTDLPSELKTALQDKHGTTPSEARKTNIDADLFNTLVHRQKETIDEFMYLQFDLSEKLGGIADYRLVQTHDSMQKSEAITHLESIKSKLLRRDFPQAAELAQTWANKMKGWADELEVN